MTRTEEAKKWLREELERLRRAPDLNGCPMTQEWAEQIRVFTVALEAIEAQDDWLCKKPCKALMDEGVCAHGGICLESDAINRVESDTVKGVEIDQFKNEPLTLEELQQMDWQPVWIPLSPPASVWALVSTSGEGAPVFTFPEGDQCLIEEWLEEVGPVYRREVSSL